LVKTPAEDRGSQDARRRLPAPPPVDRDEPRVAGQSRPVNAAAMQRLQRTAGNRAAARLLAKRRPTVSRSTPPKSTAPSRSSKAGSQPASSSAPPVSASDSIELQRLESGERGGPNSDPRFAALKADVHGKQQTMSSHLPAQSEANAAAGAAKPPQDDKEAQGKTANAEKMNKAKPGEFDKAAFVKAVNDAIAAQAPKNLDEADKFGESGKADAVKGQVQGQLEGGKKESAGQIESTTKAAPDTAAAKDKQVTPLKPDQPPPTPGAPDPAKAIPDKAPPAATDFSEGPKQVDQQMADAQVTEDQLAKSNEPEFTGALKEKKEGEKHAATAPGQVRASEAETLAGAKAQAAQTGGAAMTALAGDRKQAGAQVGEGKEGAKGKDESKRAQVTAKLQKVFDATKKDVEQILSELDKKVDDKFTKDEKAARDAFTAEHKRKMDEYKDKRYSGWDGPFKWGRDLFAGLPEEANQIFVQARKGYVDRMQQVISGIADVIGAELNRAKQRIATGRNELQAEVKKLPADLQAIGKEAAGEFSSKFDELTESVDAKGKELVNTLATKYTEALKAVDEEIEKEKEKNKGIVAKVVDAVAGAIRTILQLKDLLLGILAKAASAVMAIIKDPIGFLGNLVSAVGAGLQKFISNIAQHLKKGLVGWLTGAMSGAGLELPAKFDLRGIIMMIASLLGLTWGAIRGRIISRGVPEPAMATVEKSVPVAQKLKSEGVGGVWQDIKEKVGDLKDTLFSKISEYLIPTVLIAGITWILSLLSPASAFIRACKMIIDFVTFIITNGAQIVQFINAVLDAIIAIAGGGAGGVPALIENALSTSIPVLIGALAAILGIGGIANKVKNLFHSLSKPVLKAVDWIVDKIVKFGKKIWAKLKNKINKNKEGGNKSDSRDTFANVVRDTRETLGENPSPERASATADEVYDRHQKKGLKALNFSPAEKRPGEFEATAKASPLRRVLVFRVSDLQIRFPRTACIVHVTDPSGATENLGKFLSGRKRPGSADEDTRNHAEQIMIPILRNKYFTGDRPRGKYTFLLSITRRPCKDCGPALESLQDELRERGYEVNFHIRMASPYSSEGHEIAIKVLTSLREKGFTLEALSLEKIVAEKLLGAPEEKLEDKDRQDLASGLSEAKLALSKAEAKKGS
jgi:hypothetical protein